MFYKKKERKERTKKDRGFIGDFSPHACTITFLRCAFFSWKIEEEEERRKKQQRSEIA